VGTADPAVHGALAFGVVAAIVSARIGGAAMTWHVRLGYAVDTRASRLRALVSVVACAVGAALSARPCD